MSTTLTAGAPAVTTVDVVGRMTSDMRFVAIFSIIYGALTSLSIIGAVIGVPLIIAGLRLREAADAFDGYQAAGDSAALSRAFQRQKTFFTVYKWIIIITLILMALSMLLMFGTFMAAFGELL